VPWHSRGHAACHPSAEQVSSGLFYNPGHDRITNGGHRVPRIARGARSMGKAEENQRDKIERILAAARELFRTEGYEGTTMEDVAKRAGVSKGSVFFHALSKAALLNRVFQIDMHRWVDDALSQPAQENVLEDLVAKFAALQVSMCLQPELTRVYMSQVAFAVDEQERMFETMSLLLGCTERIINAAKAAGRIVPWIDTHQLASNTVCVLDDGRPHVVDLLKKK
jgi:AcrR family transcriptional regulator